MSKRLTSFVNIGLFCAGMSVLFACDLSSPEKTKTKHARPDPSSMSGAQPSAPPPTNAQTSDVASQPTSVVEPQFACPEGMNRVPGGAFWVGTEREVYDQEENPRFYTQVAGFCADVFEVSTQEYESCVAGAKCTPVTMNNRTCNTVAKGRANHPINCITYHQAEQVCQARGARLLSEIEWEYVARAGSEMREFPWGSDEPDGHTCWKQAGSCERGSFGAAAFGLSDVVGNVWEWTSSYWGRYPWPAMDGNQRVYRGGSWSRRFAKWMRPSLRNRQAPDEAGSHLGVRCAQSIPDEPCPYGKRADGSCQAGVDKVMCLDNYEWNGIRCARPGDTERCAAGTHEEPGHGCVREKVSGSVQTALDTSSVVRARSPEFDADCAKNAPGRPHAYRFEGGEHLGRNAVGKSLGCKNRDVGVGFNSSCCP